MIVWIIYGSQTNPKESDWIQNDKIIKQTLLDNDLQHQKAPVYQLSCKSEHFHILTAILDSKWPPYQFKMAAIWCDSSICIILPSFIKIEAIMIFLEFKKKIIFQSGGDFGMAAILKN